MFLMPSRYEPCGLNQMYSLRYGTVPLVRRTGGLADSVRHFDPVTGSEAPASCSTTTTPARSCGRSDMPWISIGTRPSGRQLVRNGMAQDFSWSRQVPRYVDAYERLLRG